MLGFSCKTDDAELIKALESLGPKCKPVLRKAIRPLAAQVKKAVKPLVPKDTGRLRKSVRIKPIVSKRFYTVGFRIFYDYVETDDGKKFYAFAPEYGVKKGHRQQTAKESMKKGATAAEAYVEATKDAIAAGIAAAFEA